MYFPEVIEAEIMIPFDTEKGVRYVTVEMSGEDGCYSWNKKQHDYFENELIAETVKNNPELINNLITSN